MRSWIGREMLEMPRQTRDKSDSCREERARGDHSATNISGEVIIRWKPEDFYLNVQFKAARYTIREKQFKTEKNIEY